MPDDLIRLKKNEETRRGLHPSTLSPFRYPGGKSWLRGRIIQWLSKLKYRPATFIEPFAGGGSVGLAVAELDLADKVQFVERDPNVAAVWQTILSDRCEELMERILRFKMNRKHVLEVFESTEDDMVARSFRCLLRNRVQRGGILSESAGLLRRGEDGRGLQSRWYPETLVERIRKIHGMRDRIAFLEGDALQILPEYATRSDAAIFVDPPYTADGKGPGYRLYPFAEINHERLFEMLGQMAGACFVTYHLSATIKRLGRIAGFNARMVQMRSTHHRIRNELVLLKG